MIWLAPIDPQKSVNQTSNDFMNWFSTHAGLLIGAAVVALVLIGLYKAMPKWLFLVILVAVTAMVLGVKMHG